MPAAIKPIRLALPYRSGTVNCYLLTTGTDRLLIDTGSSNQRVAVEQELARAGCQPGDLKLIVLTHGDFDHTGNAVHLRQKLGAQIAMHAGDAGMLEHGDLFENTKQPALNAIMDDSPTAQASVERLKGLEVKTVFPGHGRPFLWEHFSKP